MSQAAGAPWQEPTPNDFQPRTLPRETARESTGDGWTQLGAILPSVLSDLADRIEAATVDYEPCPHCHRASWSHVQHLIESAKRSERAAIEWEEFAAGEELSKRELLTRLELVRAALTPRPPQPKGERRFLEVVK